MFVPFYSDWNIQFRQCKFHLGIEICQKLNGLQHSQVRDFEGFVESHFVHVTVIYQYNAIALPHLLSRQECPLYYAGIVGGVVPLSYSSKKFIELNKLTGEFEFVEEIGSNPQSIYIPIINLNKSSLRFPIDVLVLRR